MKYKNTKINIFKGDITEQKVDAIVNAANNTLLGGGGVDGAIHIKGGRIILEQCKKIGGCPTGEARITTAGDLPCKYVIHTVGPIYGANHDRKNLYNSYFNSLKLALNYDIKTIAFPAISTGAYNYPVEEAAEISGTAINDFLDAYEGLDEINIILYNDKNFEVFKESFSKRFI
ncbi:macro domain-containing protein [Tissierella sp. Yu-01]|uniref:macro domain-containing protein n=1 Tax=Tissierella sp. Yu-01 TaxID=3035694 RepID=UPI00240E68E1|nr:macro domain-containing protein [Tissierella sp. Yu-01]WFA09863.1 macro domain-containing protein [Tissierella sp. Yu-01]